jgi:hypothetical protein
MQLETRDTCSTAQVNWLPVKGQVEWQVQIWKEAEVGGLYEDILFWRDFVKSRKTENGRYRGMDSKHVPSEYKDKVVTVP